MVYTVYHYWSISVLKLILYSVRFEERKMEHEKSYTNHQLINKIGNYTCSSSLFSVGFNVVQYIFIKGFTGEIERDKICCNNKSYSIDEKKKQAYLTNLRKYNAKTNFLSNILFISIWKGPMDQKKLQSLNTSA